MNSESFTYLLCLFCQHMFQVESVNCICVDWESGSHTTYTQASQNTRIVGGRSGLFCRSPSGNFYMQNPMHAALWIFFQNNNNNDNKNTVIWLSPLLEKKFFLNLDLGFNNNAPEVQ